jgi:hypothetical protein
MLMQAGLPREALLITVVWTPQNNGHAVLIVRTDKGDYVLDNLSSRVALWNQTPYDYVMRQTQANPNDWVYIDGDPLKPAKLTEDIAEKPHNEPTVMVSGLNNGAAKLEAIVANDAESAKSKPQVLASRSIDDSAPLRTIAAPPPTPDSAPKPKMVADRGTEPGALAADAIVSLRAGVATPKQPVTVASGEAATSEQQALTVNMIDNNLLRQLLANGIDGETLMQLVIADNLRDSEGLTQPSVKVTVPSQVSKQRVSIALPIRWSFGGWGAPN